MRRTLFKRVGALLLTLVLLLTLSLPGFAEGARGGAYSNPFTDVKEGKYYYDAVLWAVNHKPPIASGLSATKFGVNESCTRAQMATFLYAAAGRPAVEVTENPFKDVKAGKWYYDAVMWAVQNGITSGMSDTVFGINETCTRAQAVTFLYAMAGTPPVETQDNPFSDVPENKWYRNAVLWAFENGVTGGATPTTFAPNNKCTRGQIVTFLYKATDEYTGFISKPDENGNYVRSDDDTIYNLNLRDYASLMEQARSADTNDERFLLFAQAEAALLDSAALIPTTSQGGGYAMSRVAPHAEPFAMWGSDPQRLGELVISDSFLTRDERNELQAQWEAAVAGSGSYDPAAYLSGKGHTLQTAYTGTFNTELQTLDWLNSSRSTDSVFLANCVEGLAQYDNLGNLQPALAESWEVSRDGKTYTFHIRRGVKWTTAAGAAYAELTARDFVAGFRHMLDCQAGLESLAGYGGAQIVGVEDYLYGAADFSGVGCKATDDYTLVFTLNQPVPYFMSMLSYSIFLPLCDSFYRSRGGVYGVSEYEEAYCNGSISYGLPGDPSSQVYCGPFLMRSVSSGEVSMVRNSRYYKAGSVRLNTLRWLNVNDMYSADIYNMALNGEFTAVSLSAATGMLDWAREDGYFEEYAYVTETNSTTYFGSLNLNRGTFVLENGACASPKNEQQKADTATALNNKSFRKALLHAFDKASYNAVSRGDELAETNLRNMLTPPEFVKLENAVTDKDGHSFPAGTFYGEMVQYYCDQLGCQVDCADGTNGWYKPDAARDYLRQARIELGSSVSWPIQIDFVYYGFSTVQNEQAHAYKNLIEGTLGAENVTVNLIEAEQSADYYSSTYLASTGSQMNFDFSCLSGWGPDFGDPCTYLDIFDHAVNGYMLMSLGLY